METAVQNAAGNSEGICGTMGMSKGSDIRALPDSPDTERMVLGSVFVQDSADKIAELPAEYFSSEAHRRILNGIKALHESGVRVDRNLLAEKLVRQGQLESVGGLSYLVSLDEGLPELVDLDGYIAILGEYATRRAVIIRATELAESAYLGAVGGEELKTKAEALADGIGISVSVDRSEGRTPLEVVDQYPGGAASFLDPTKRKKGLYTGFHDLDELTGGFKEGEMIVIAAHTSHGKTAFALNILEHMCFKLGKKAAYFTFEMSDESLLMRMVCSMARVNYMRWQHNYLDDGEKRRMGEALMKITETDNLRFFDQGMTMPQIERAATKMKDKHGLDIGVTDYLQLVSSSGKDENRAQEVGKMSRHTKIMASNLKIPWITLSQFSRAGAKRADMRPVLSDLKESSSVEQDANLALFLYREWMFRREREDLRGIADLEIAKQRNGPLGRIKLSFVDAFARFENYSERRED